MKENRFTCVLIFCYIGFGVDAEVWTSYRTATGFGNRQGLCCAVC